jgi:hypothetical protein
LGRLSVWLVVPVVFVVYILTISPTVGLIDSGELAAGCYLLNILHPTGYPLYTMLGRLASLAPIGMVVNRVGALSALLGSCGVGLFLLLGLRLGVSRTTAGASALLLGFSLPVWAVAVDVEVYSLTLVLVLLLWLAAESAGRGEPLLILAYLAGLALTNHMSAASTVLGVVLAVILVYRRELVRRIPVLVLLFLLGISPYVFLVLRARAGPLFAWGDPHNLERLYWHVTGRQYQVWMFSQSFGEVMHNAGRGAELLARSFVYVLVPVVFYGAVVLFRQRRSLAIGLAVSAVVAFAYAVNYSIPDIESYYLPCLVALAVFGVVGLDGLARRVGKLRHAAWLAGILALLINFRVAGKQGDYVAYDYAMNTLASAGQNATVITDWWDVYSPVFYLQHVEHVRPDVCIIDKELVRRSWYFNYLSRAYPWLVERSRPEIEGYRQYLDEFEQGRLKDPAEIQRRYIALLESFITHNPERPAYTTFEANANADARQLLAGATLAPVGLLFRIMPGVGDRGPGTGAGTLSPDTWPRASGPLPEFDYTRLVVRLPRHEPDARTQAVLERYQYFLTCRVRALVNSRRDDEIKPLLGWYESLPLSRLVPLPVR